MEAKGHVGLGAKLDINLSLRYKIWSQGFFWNAGVHCWFAFPIRPPGKPPRQPISLNSHYLFFFFKAFMPLTSPLVSNDGSFQGVGLRYFLNFRGPVDLREELDWAEKQPSLHPFSKRQEHLRNRSFLQAVWTVCVLSSETASWLW